MPDLEGLLQRLVDHQLEFVIVGGYAVMTHGATLVTQDVGICCPFTPRHLLALHEAIVDLHPVHRLVPRKPPLQLTVASPTLCQHVTPS